MPPDAPLWESRLLPQGNACTSRIAHNKIDLKQHKKLRAFKQVTYKKALTGSFSTVDGLRQTLLRDLLRQFGALASIQITMEKATNQRLYIPQGVNPKEEKGPCIGQHCGSSQ